MTLANLDQALRMILAEELAKTSIRDAEDVRNGNETWRLTVALEAMRRAYRLAESKNELSKMIGEPPAPQACKEGLGNE